MPPLRTLQWSRLLSTLRDAGSPLADRLDALSSLHREAQALRDNAAADPDLAKPVGDGSLACDRVYNTCGGSER